MTRVGEPGRPGFAFLPISFFKSREIMTGDWIPRLVFESSGTTGQVPSRHRVRDPEWYYAIARRSFPPGWGSPDDHVWVALLPSYLERPNSSLVAMVRHFASAQGKSDTNFFKTPGEALLSLLSRLRDEGRRTILIGVAYALLDLFEQFTVPVWEELLVLETGGMKGRGRELTREELYGRIRANAPSVRLSGEYGMTELMSQAYRIGDRFRPGPAMRVLARDIGDPFQRLPAGERGALDIIDLANLDTCSFIATEDTGVVYPDGTFEVTGRMHASEVRGCNLMYTG